MKTQKMSIKIVGEKLSRSEMKNIMAGGAPSGCPLECSSSNCTGTCECFNSGTSNSYCGTHR